MTSYPVFRLSSIGRLGIALLVVTAANAQTPATGGPTTATITRAWSGVLQDAIPQTPVDPAVGVAQNPVQRGAADDLLNHFYFDTRTEYIRENLFFTGQPTAAGVMNVAPNGLFNPNGIPDPLAFQPSGNWIYSFMDFGTNGWISDRVNTHFSIRYRQDLTHIDQGSPQETILNTFPSNRRIEFLTGNVEINGRPTDGWFAGSTITVGRQYIYGAELAELDGGSFTMNRANYSYTLFGGRRFSFFSDPDQRAVGGGNFLYRFGHAGSLEYDTLFYIKGTHHVVYRRRLGPRWLFSAGYKMIGSYPIDLILNGIWSSSNGRTTVRLAFWEKLTNKDYFYDYTLNARDLDPNNPLLRLYLGPQSPYSQFVIDARRTFNSRMRVGGSVWVRRLTDSKDQGPFDTSFTDYRVDAQLVLIRPVQLFLGFHERDSDRLNPLPSSDFFDISATGETKIQDFTAEIGRSFGEKGKITLKAGGFYRRLNFQDQFFVLNHLHDRGLLGNVSMKVDARTRVYFDYDLDTDFFVFSPNVKYAQVLRIGVAWKY
jgi:hypothetical protein